MPPIGPFFTGSWSCLKSSARHTLSNKTVDKNQLKCGFDQQAQQLTRIDNPAATTHVRELLIECKKQLLKLKGNVTEFNSWVRQQANKLHAQDQEAMDLTNYLWKAYKAAPDEDFITYIKDKKSQVDDARASYNAEELMTVAENNMKQGCWMRTMPGEHHLNKNKFWP